MFGFYGCSQVFALLFVSGKLWYNWKPDLYPDRIEESDPPTHLSCCHHQQVPPHSSFSLSCSLSLWLMFAVLMWVNLNNEPSIPGRHQSEIKYFNYFPPVSALKLVLCHSMPCVYGNIHVIGDGLTAVAPHFLLFILHHASARRTRELMGQADLYSVPTLPILSTLAHPWTLSLCHLAHSAHPLTSLFPWIMILK